MRIFYIFFIPLINQRKIELLNQLRQNITEYDRLIIIRKNRHLIDYIRKNPYKD
jgi:hypothetical protein